MPDRCLCRGQNVLDFKSVKLIRGGGQHFLKSLKSNWHFLRGEYVKQTNMVFSGISHISYLIVYFILSLGHINLYQETFRRPASWTSILLDTSLYNIWVRVIRNRQSLHSHLSRIFLVLGVLGNLATCLVIVKNEYMRTTTNIYLFNLAVTDLATLIFAMPSELYLMWRQYPWTFGEVRKHAGAELC